MKIVDIMAKQNKTPKFNGEQMLREDTYSSFTELSDILQIYPLFKYNIQLVIK
jgi:hypothetical protein